MSTKQRILDEALTLLEKEMTAFCNEMPET